MKKTNLLWSFSLMAIGICTIILVGANLLSIEMPDFITRVLGLAELTALPVLGYTTVKRMKNKQ